MAERMGSFYRVQVRSARAAQLVQLGECRRPRPITFPFSLSLVPILRPVPSPPRKLPPGPTAFFPTFHPLAPLPIRTTPPDTAVLAGMGVRAPCACLSLLPNLLPAPSVRPAPSAAGTRTALLGFYQIPYETPTYRSNPPDPTRAGLEQVEPTPGSDLSAREFYPSSRATPKSEGGARNIALEGNGPSCILYFGI